LIGKQLEYCLKEEKCPEIVMVASHSIVWNGNKGPKTIMDFTYPSNSDVTYYDPYHILHIRRDATNYEMRRAYQQLAILYHPTLSISQPPPELVSSIQKQKQLAFAVISASYETLSNMETRQRMDTLLVQQQPHHSENSNLDRFPKRNKERNRHRTMIISKEEQKLRKLIQDERLLQHQGRKDKKSSTRKKLSPFVTRLSSNVIKDTAHNLVVQDTPKIHLPSAQNTSQCGVESSTITTDRIIFHKSAQKPDVVGPFKGKKSSVIPPNKNQMPGNRCRRRGCDWNSCASSPCYTSSFENDHAASLHAKLYRKTPVPPLLLSDSDDSDSESTCVDDQGTDVHHSTRDTERWFGGPLKLMYRARRFQPFTDPFVLFDRVFHSGFSPSQRHASFTALSTTKREAQVEPCLPLIAIGSSLAPLSPANDTTENIRNGIAVTMAQRSQIPYTVTSDPAEAMVKVISRTVTRYPPDPLSGKRRAVIQVTSNYSSPGPASDQDDDPSFASFCWSWLPFG
jgi:DnaJ domain